MAEPIDPAITSKIIQALASYLKRDPASITESHHLRDDLGLDSVAIIELLFEIEERFKLQIPDQDLPGLSTVGTVAAYVQRRLAEPKAESKPEPAKSATAASKPKSAKSTTVKSSTTKKTASPKPASVRKPKKASAVTPGKKKVATR
ncbi:MAG: phosphopantetheine-binding protein [Nitrospira sp.]|nr:phosphopantetheine-binding protein [Nitrospira sp.]